MMLSSRVMARIALFTSLLILSGGLMAAASSGGRRAPQDDPAIMRKLSPWVLQKTAEGETADFLVVLRDQADLSAAEALPTKEEKGRYVFETLLAHARRSQESLVTWLQDRQIDYQSFYIVNMVLVKGDRTVAVELAARDEVDRIEGNPILSGIRPVDAPEASAQYLTASPDGPNGIELGVSYIRAPEVWAAGYTGQGIVIGGQDTGVTWDHPSLRNQYRGWDGAKANHDYNWHDSVHSGGGLCGPDTKVPCDDHNHGTHTLGTALGTDGGANQIGVAPGAKFIACRNMDRGNGTPATYLECFQFFLAPYPVKGKPEEGDPSQAPDLTTNSWSCPPSEGCAPGTLQAAVEAQRAAGIMTIVAAGNEGSGGCATVSDPPGIYDASYTIGALNAATGLLASFSSRGPVTIDGSRRPKPDLTAPGVGVRSALRGGGYASLNGTSMATPHVAGAVALLWSAFPYLRGQIDLTENILNESAVRLESSDCGSQGIPNALFGYGRLDIKAAFDLAAARRYEIGGRITTSGLGLSRVTVAFTRISGNGAIPPPVETDLEGRWSQFGFEPGTVYRITPTRGRAQFSPAYQEIGAPSSQVNFATVTRRIVIIN